jgi:hypothetical protein
VTTVPDAFALASAVTMHCTGLLTGTLNALADSDRLLSILVVDAFLVGLIHSGSVGFIDALSSMLSTDHLFRFRHSCNHLSREVWLKS